MISDPGTFPELTPSLPSAAVKEMAGTEGFPFSDLKPSLVTEARREYEQTGGLLWWADDTHWNAAGYRAVAEALYDGLLSRE